MSQRLQNQLLQIFDRLFQRQSLQRSIYLFSQMKPNLELPFSSVLRQRKVQTVTSDEKIIWQALKKCDRVITHEDRKTVQIKLQPGKSRLIIKTDDKRIVEFVENILRDHMRQVETRPEIEKNGIAINLASEEEAQQLKNLLDKNQETKLNIHFEERDPYNELKDSIQRYKKQKKQKIQGYGGYEAERTNNSGFYQGGQGQMQPQQWPAQYMMPPGYGFGYGGFPPYGRADRQRSAGFTRKAIESSDEEEPMEKKPKYREKEEQPKQTQVSEIQKRTRLNSQNFPSLEDEAKVEQKVLKHKYQKKQIVEIFKDLILNNSIKINGDLQKSGIPLLRPDGNLRLEVMKQGGRKQSTFDSPKISPIGNRKSSN